MNAWPARALGGSSPVVAIFRHSMTVCRWRGEGYAGEKNVREKNAGRMGASRGELGTPPRDPGCPGVHRSTYRLSRAVAPDDEGQGLGEYDGVVVIGAEAADALYEHLVDGAHDGVAAGFQTQSRKRGVPTRGERDLRDEGGSRCGRARRPAARYGRANEARA